MGDKIGASQKIYVDYDTGAVERILKKLSGEALDQAWRRALQKTGAWVKTCVTRELGKTAKIPRKALMIGGRRKSPRLEAYFDRNDEGVMKVWLGLRPIDAHRLAYGKGATQTRSGGVRAGPHRFPHAFLMPIYGKNSQGQRVKVMRNRVTRSGKSISEAKTIVMQRRGRNRLPLDKVTLDFQAQGNTAMQNAAKGVADTLIKKLRSEVRFELSKQDGNAQ